MHGKEDEKSVKCAVLTSELPIPGVAMPFWDRRLFQKPRRTQLDFTVPRSSFRPA
jgi:hypothetical protein